MNHYPSWWNETITVYNRYTDPVSKLITWYRHIVHGAFWKDIGNNITIDKTVIATGGSVIYGAEAMEHLKEIGTVVYLKLDYETLDSRLGSLKGRGVVLKDGQTLKSLYEERVPLYEKYADVIVDEYGLDLEATLSEVLHKIG